MPVDWIAILASTAVSNLLGPRLKEGFEAVREGAKDAFVNGPLEGPLRTVYSDACKAFLGSLRVVHMIDASTEAQIKVLMEDEAFLNALRQLPFVPVREISTEVSREQFVALGLPGAEAADFDAAWNALYRKFRIAAVSDKELKNLLDHTLAADQGEKLDDLVTLVHEIKTNLATADRRGRDLAIDISPDHVALDEQLSILQEKLADLRKGAAITADPALKFQLKKQIEETKRELVEVKSEMSTSGKFPKAIPPK